MRAFIAPWAGAGIVGPAEIPVPVISDDELLVRVQAFGVGIHDASFLPTDAEHPYPIGIEGAGVVEDVGGRVEAHQPGDRIAFVSSMQRKGGTWAELAAVAADALIVKIPSGMGFVEAAAVPVAGSTVLRTMAALAGVPTGAAVFIAGGSGAIGTLAVQVARRRGWRVAASASPPNHDHLLSLGAEVAVDYRDPGWPDEVRRWAPGGVDAAIAVQPGTATDSMGVVRDGGQVVAVSGDQVSSERHVSVSMPPHQADVQDGLVRLMAEIAAGEVHVHVEHVYPFEEALDALAKVTTRHARGKVVVQVERGASAPGPSRGSVGSGP